MRRLQNSGLVLRKLSVFFIFFGILGVVLLFYFARIVPSNESDLNIRAQRTLNQLAINFLEKDREVQSLFKLPPEGTTSESWSKIIMSKRMNFANLDNLVYRSSMVPMNCPDPKARLVDCSLLRKSSDNWEWIYYGVITKPGSTCEQLEITIPLKTFVKPLLENRGDIFSNYILLLDSPATGKSRNLPLLYTQDPVTFSDVLSSDTLSATQKNSDGSAASDISISGEVFKIFYHPFVMHGQRLLLGGLLSRDDYLHRTRQTPVNYIPGIIIIILILLLSLPFIKIFMIGHKETINYTDMALTASSFYLGPVCGCLIIFYSVLHIVNGITFSHRLNLLGQSLQKSVDKNLSEADTRLRSYDSLNFSEVTACLEDPVDDNPCMSELDSMMSRHIDRHTIRVFWIDSLGKTLAKWNPYDFVAPNTDVSNYMFYKKFIDSKPPSLSPADSFYTVYAGKSNATGEFLVFMIRPSTKAFYKANKMLVAGDTLRSFGIVEAMDLDVSQHPVLPPGFTFSLVDKDGVVLVDSDPSRNLSENIIDESGQNIASKRALQGMDPGTDLNVSLYGQSFLVQARPINNQSLTLLVMYDQKFISENIIRLLLFAIQTFVWLTIALCVCLLFSTSKTIAPSHLRFKVRSIEWIRPIVSNEISYGFTYRFFIVIIIAFACQYILLVITNHDLRSIYYIAIITPFWGIWGFIVSRTKKYSGERRFLQSIKDIFTLGRYPAGFTIAINLLLIFLFAETGWPVGSVIMIFSFQSFLFLLLLYLTYRHPNYRFKGLKFLAGKQNSYQASLLLSLAVMSVLPAAGVLTYGYQAEKLQYKKDKLLGYASAFQSWEEYLQHDLTVGYKDLVKKYLGTHAFDHDLFLTDNDQLDTIKPKLSSYSNHDMALPDELYMRLVNKAASFSGADKAFLATSHKSNDETWDFKLKKGTFLNAPILQLDDKPLQKSTGIPMMHASTKIQNVVVDFFHLPFAFWLLCIVLIFLIIWGFVILVKATIRRLFLRNFIEMGRVRVDYRFLNGVLNSTFITKPFLRDCHIPDIINCKFFESEFAYGSFMYASKFSQEDYILALSGSFKNAYEEIWKRLSPAEQYVLYDFCIDYYTNYKNVEIFISLIQKGIIHERNKSWEIFSLSFRQFVLSKKDSPEINKLLLEFRTSGNWEAFRISSLSFIAIAGIMIVSTQSEISHKLLAVLTSLTALFPIVLKLLQSDPKIDKTSQKTGASES